MSNSSDKSRYFGLSNLAVDNRTSVMLLVFMIFLFGYASYVALPKESFPEIVVPNIMVTTVSFGNSAEDIENLITRPLEKEIQSVTGIKEMNSSSLQDFSIINIEFQTGEDIETALRKVKDAVDKARSELPSDLTEEPNVEDIDFSEFPIMTINVSGDVQNDELKSYAEYLEDEIEDLREVSRVELKGSREKEVQVLVDMIKMQSLQISFNDLSNAIASENVTLSGGELVKDGFRRNVKVAGEFEDVNEIENLIVKAENGRSVYLRDLGEVKMGFEESKSIARADGDPVISLDIIKRKGENLIDAAYAIKAIVAKAEKDVLPDEITIGVFNDQSINTEVSVTSLENSIISGVILVVFVLLFFLGLRNASFVGMAIPLSMLLGILILSLLGITLNMVVLFALVLALGLLVDNAIVVVENIYRFKQSGLDNVEAAKRGVGEVAWPIIASTATTLAAFVPLAFWPGLMGQFMKYLPITLIIVLSSSLFVALVINPVLTANFIKIEDKIVDPVRLRKRRRNVLIGAMIFLVVAVALFFLDTAIKPDDRHHPVVFSFANIFAFIAVFNVLQFFAFRPAANYFQGKFLPALEKRYYAFVNFALRKYNPLFFFFGTVVLMLMVFGLLGAKSPKIVFFPEADPLYVNVFVELPNGSDINATSDLVRDIEQKVIKVLEPWGKIPETVLTQIGENTSDPSEPPQPGSSPNRARITVPFVPSDQRPDMSTFDIMDDIREAVGKRAGVELSIDKNAEGPPTGKPISIEITGEEIDKIVSIADDMKVYINKEGIAGIEELKTSVKLSKPELIVNLDREAARRYEISTYQVANTIRTALFGAEVSKFKEGEDEYPIQLRLDDRYRNNIDDLLNQKITFRSQATGQVIQVPISAVADVEYTRSYNMIQRKDMDRSVTVFSNVLGGYNANEVVAQIQESLQYYEMPAGYKFEFRGEQEEMAENMAFLSRAFMLAIFAIFIILVSQFNSVVSPFIIILSVLFSTIGVFLGYILTSMDIVLIMTGVGIISLAGVVVNNAIVLMDYINLLISNKRKEQGHSSLYAMKKADVKAAIIEGGATRLRPVLLTAITTILGLIPLAIGFNINFFTLLSNWDAQYFLGGDNVAFWGPLAWTVIYGLVFATFLTLVVVPVMYWLAYRLNYAIKNRAKKSTVVLPAK